MRHERDDSTHVPGSVGVQIAQPSQQTSRSVSSQGCSVVQGNFTYKLHSWDPTAGLCMGSYDGPRGEGCFL